MRVSICKISEWDHATVARALWEYTNSRSLSKRGLENRLIDNEELKKHLPNNTLDQELIEELCDEVQREIGEDHVVGDFEINGEMHFVIWKD